MSIRLRLTLIYSALIALILISFSLVLYYGQDRATRQDFQRRLAEEAQAVISGRQSPLPVSVDQPPKPPFNEQPPPDDNQLAGSPGGEKQPPPPPPRPQEIFYIQTRNLEGQVVDRDPSMDQAVLPLSDAGLQAIKGGQYWVENGWIRDERVLIYSQLVLGSYGDTKIVQVAGSLAILERDLDSLRNILIIASSITMIGAFGIGWLLASLALRPIHHLTRAAQEIGTRRDFSRRVDHTGPNDEIGQLATTFNGMLAALQAAYLHVEQSLRAQRYFAADASHELRSPLTTIRGNLGLLQREPPISQADKADVLSDTVDETERLMRLVSDLLTLARADEKRPLHNKPISVKPLLEEVCQQVELLGPDHILVCRFKTEVTVVGDRDALKQVLLILCDNAIKHTPPNTNITIAVTVAEEWIDISVCDNGPGIEPSQLTHIFERFYRGDVARTGNGAGLGLAIAKELTEVQNGTLTVESRLGQGTVFTLTFPKISL